MRLGIWEIGLIVILVLVIFFATRFARSRKSHADESGSNAEMRTTKREDKASWRKHPLLGKAGIALIIIGVIVLLLSLSVLKWVFWGSIWACVIALVGFAIIVIAKR